VPVRNRRLPSRRSQRGFIVNPFVFAGDPFFANVVILAPLSAQVSSAFVDQSSYARTLTSVANVALDTSQYPFPPASATFDGTGDTITTPITSALQPGTTDFTLECYVRPPTPLPGSLRFIFSTRSTAGNDAGVYMFLNSSGFVEFRVPPGNGGTNLVSMLSNTTLPAAAWTHVCIIRVGVDWYMFFNGTNVAHATVSSGMSVASTNGSLWIGGSSNEAGGREWLGNIGPVRWTIGGSTQRYNQTAFTPDPLPWFAK